MHNNSVSAIEVFSSSRISHIERCGYVSCIINRTMRWCDSSSHDGTKHLILILGVSKQENSDVVYLHAWQRTHQQRGNHTTHVWYSLSFSLLFCCVDERGRDWSECLCMFSFPATIALYAERSVINQVSTVDTLIRGGVINCEIMLKTRWFIYIKTRRIFF